MRYGTLLIFHVKAPHCNKIISNPEITDILNMLYYVICCEFSEECVLLFSESFCRHRMLRGVYHTLHPERGFEGDYGIATMPSVMGCAVYMHSVSRGWEFVCQNVRRICCTYKP